MLYHANFGPPLLEEGARLLAPVEAVTPFNDHAARDVKRYDQYSGPKPGFIEQVYTIQPLADRSGRTLVMLRNKAADRGRVAALRHPRAALPDPLEEHWPTSRTVTSRGSSRAPTIPTTAGSSAIHGRVPALSPGESHYMTIDFAVHVGADEVQKAAREIEQIQGDRRPLINEKPEKKE